MFYLAIAVVMWQQGSLQQEANYESFLSWGAALGSLDRPTRIPLKLLIVGGVGQMKTIFLRPPCR